MSIYLYHREYGRVFLTDAIVHFFCASQARSALRTAAEFLRRLQKEAEAEDETITAFALLQSRALLISR